MSGDKSPEEQRRSWVSILAALWKPVGALAAAITALLVIKTGLPQLFNFGPSAKVAGLYSPIGNVRKSDCGFYNWDSPAPAAMSKSEAESVASQVTITNSSKEVLVVTNFWVEKLNVSGHWYDPVKIPMTGDQTVKPGSSLKLSWRVGEATAQAHRNAPYGIEPAGCAEFRIRLSTNLGTVRSSTYSYVIPTPTDAGPPTSLPLGYR